MTRGRVQITFIHRVLITVVVIGALTVASIGFAGSYSAVSDLATRQGFGAYAPWFPIGVDVSILMLLSLDVLLDWLGMTLVLLRYAAWLLSAATIVFNAMAAYPSTLGMSMHGTIPIAFLAAVEAARRAISRIAGLSHDRRMDSVRSSRWLLAPVSTALLWRRMKLYELRSYDEVIKLEQERLVYQARLRSRFGRGWRRKAPVESLMPLRLARYGVPLDQTAPAGLAAAGIGPALQSPASAGAAVQRGRELVQTEAEGGTEPGERREPEPEPAPAGREDATVDEDQEPDSGQERSEKTLELEEQDDEQQEQQEPEDDGSRHAEVIDDLKPADAIRYAIEVLNSVDVPTVKRWLKDHGKTVNSGQVWRIAQKAKPDDTPEEETSATVRTAAAV
ncbi:DUF2637 domain-containing protein [Streptomyces noursei]|uniref:DUF2637 domain-containing protein n=1 Tax=Streptomyces noursei TaxID=1971 RepID=UPI0019B9B51D|nr:DUF2637 domain-containing protein [Streptomyces noursei]MCZ1021406.1 DUF2637 domain-containing protein [Streptomyces noursei]GGX46243.1 hypothetical protein GCM10010341_79930 [Streptomyces noursei]